MIEKARRYKTLVLDLRGNGGGAIAALRELVSRCFDHEVHDRHRAGSAARSERDVAQPSSAAASAAG